MTNRNDTPENAAFTIAPSGGTTTITGNWVNEQGHQLLEVADLNGGRLLLHPNQLAALSTALDLANRKHNR